MVVAQPGLEVAQSPKSMALLSKTWRTAKATTPPQIQVAKHVKANNVKAKPYRVPAGWYPTGYGGGMKVLDLSGKGHSPSPRGGLGPQG